MNDIFLNWNDHRVTVEYTKRSITWECASCGTEFSIEVDDMTYIPHNQRTATAPRVFENIDCTTPTKNQNIPDHLVPDKSVKIDGSNRGGV